MGKSGFLLLLLLVGSLLAGPPDDRAAATPPNPVIADGAVRLAPTTDSGRRLSKRLWQISLAGVAAANALDVQSSWGKHELNGALAGANGSFGARGAALKLSMQAGMVVVERRLLGHRPTAGGYRAAAIANFIVASVIGGVAAHNYGVPQPAGR
jgi:hypothetical protein